MVLIKKLWGARQILAYSLWFWTPTNVICAWSESNKTLYIYIHVYIYICVTFFFLLQTLNPLNPGHCSLVPGHLGQGTKPGIVSGIPGQLAAL